VLLNLLCGVNIFITRGCLSSVRVIMVHMHVSLVELLCQAAMGLISALGYILSCVRGLLYLRPIVLGGLGHRLLRPWGGQCLSIPESLRTCLTGGPYFTQVKRGGTGRQVTKSCLPAPILRHDASGTGSGQPACTHSVHKVA
jgi:hypothetical protein